MRSKHLYIHKSLAVAILLWAISINSFTYANEDQAIYDEAKTRINNVQGPASAWDPTAPLGKDQKWSIANVLSRVFDGTWKIRSIFIAAFDNLTVWYVPLWTGTDFNNSIIEQSWSTINIQWDINIEWEIFTSSSIFSSWLWTETWSAIYYNSGSVGVWVASPDSTLHVGGDIKIGDSLDPCDVSKAGALRFNAGYIQLCATD